MCMISTEGSNNESMRMNEDSMMFYNIKEFKFKRFIKKYLRYVHMKIGKIV